MALRLIATRTSKCHLVLKSPKNFKTCIDMKNISTSPEFLRNLSALLCARPPKGFEKFYKDKKPTKDSSAEKPKEEPKSAPPPPKSEKSQEFKKEFTFKMDFPDFGKKGGSGSGSGNFDPNMDPYKTAAMLAGGLAVAYILYMPAYEEISWKEFVNKHLMTGQVHHLEVVNKKWVRIHTHDGNNGPYKWFSIGSPEGFERNLENVQMDAQIEPANFVPVLYKDQMDSGTVMRNLPSLLTLAFFP